MSTISTRKFSPTLSEDAESSSRTARRITFNSDVLKVTKICAGDVIAICADTASTKAYAVGTAWPSLGLPHDTVVLSPSLFLAAKLSAQDKLRVLPLNGAASSNKPMPNVPTLKNIQEAGTIKLREGNVPNTPETGKQREWLILLLRELLVDLKYIMSTQTLQITYEGHIRTFSLVSVSSQNDSKPVDKLADGLSALSIQPAAKLWTVGWDTSIIIVSEDKEKSALAHKPEIEALARDRSVEAYTSVGGLEKQIAEIRDLLEIPLTRPELFRYFSLKPPRGILLHGPPGTGKTHLARAIASSTNSSVLIINGPELSSAYHGETESKLRDVFKEAKEKSPCIVVLDEVDALVPRREDGAGGEVEKRVVATLLTILDGMEDDGEDNARVVVIGTTNRPNAIDPALRRPGRFDREIEIGIPDADARLSILNVLLLKTPHSLTQDNLRAIAARAHGYVGADLGAVVREAGTIAIKRWLATTPGDQNNAPKSLTLTLPDMLSSLPTIRPSGMRSLFVDTPAIRYSDIGGQASVIQKLRESVEWPLLHPEAFERLGVRPPKGVLLYGPPGCSKTVLARACACESGVNFVAVKGPELLNKYVGESERAVREIFSKARAAAPSIIFFDEIDALATSRTSADGGDTGPGSHEGVLTSLLNELDGVQELVGVTIIAATNRPESIDSALMRPGRLDRILYVGPPDQQGREEILRIRTRKMTVEPDMDLLHIAKITEGCSGAEISALCQEAALLTMQKDINAPFVPHDAFLSAARAMKRQITPAVIEKFSRWSRESGAVII